MVRFFQESMRGQSLCPGRGLASLRRLIAQRILAFGLIGALALSLLPPLHVQAATAVDVSSGAEFQSALSSADSNIDLNLTNDFDLTTSTVISGEKTIRIQGNGHKVTLQGDAQMLRITSSADSHLTVENLTIDGTNATGTYTYGGSAIYVYAGDVTLEHVLIQNCKTSAGGYGGAVHTEDATLTAKNCAFIGNTAKYDGGAIEADDKAYLTNCTFYNNESGHYGGAIYVGNGGEIVNCTVVKNNAKTYGGGIYNAQTAAAKQTSLKNCIIIGNTINGSETGNNGTDIYRSVDGGNNLYGKAYSSFQKAASSTNNVAYPANWLASGAPTNNGGNGLPVIALLDVPGSPAIDQGNSTGAPNTDQRGVLRDNTPDIGAFELAFGVTNVSVAPATVNVQKGQTQLFTANVAVTGSTAQTVDWTVAGGLSSRTSISAGGLLTVGSDETAATLTVKATSTADPSKHDTATVTVIAAPPSITSVSITPTSADVAKGDSQTFSPTVTGTNNPNTAVTWQVNSTLSTINAQGLLTVGANETAQSLTVTATSVADSTKSAGATVNVLSEFHVSTGSQFNAAMKSNLNPLPIYIESDFDGVDTTAVSSAKTLRIYGQNHTIKQSATGVTVRLTRTSGNDVTIRDLTIDGDGSVTDYKHGGGAIYLAGGDLNLENVTIENCAVTDPNLDGGGGAVCVALKSPSNSLTVNGSITAENCSFINNQVNGGTLDHFGGALSADKVYLTNCTFYGNATSRSSGGAVYARLGGSMVNCTVIRNSAGLSGGGVTGRVNEIDGNRGRLHLLNCIVAGNRNSTHQPGLTGVNVDQIYDQGGNVFGSVLLQVTGGSAQTARDELWSDNGHYNTGIGSVANIAETDGALSAWLDLDSPKANGGTSPTLKLLDVANSPALDKGVALGISSVQGVAALTAPAKDQRGVVRDTRPDVGAYEHTATNPTYGITHSVLGNTHNFAEDAYGYAAPAPLAVTITNIGNTATGNLQIALSGTHSSDFSLDKTSLNSIALYGRDTFSLSPKVGLQPGAYSTTVTISGNNGIFSSFRANFTVRKATGAAASTPVLVGKTQTTITIQVQPTPANGQTVLYAISTTNTAPANAAPANATDRKTALTFSNLTPATQYYIFARTAENANYEAGTPATALAVKTDSKTPAATISVKTPTALKVKAGKKKLIIKWKKVVGAFAYQIRYKIKKSKTLKTKIVSAKKAKLIVKKVKKGSRYQVQIRTCKKLGSKTYYSPWSKTKTSKKIK